MKLKIIEMVERLKRDGTYISRGRRGGEITTLLFWHLVGLDSGSLTDETGLRDASAP